jgi:acyl-CoA synthetase (AMP-forming)/AMP-acid ligase II
MWNQFKTLVLLASISGILVVVGGVIGGRMGMIFGLGLGAFMNLVSWWKSDALVMRMTGAREVPLGSMPELHGIVEELALRAGIPKPKVLYVDDGTPNAFATGRSPRHAAVAVTRGLVQTLVERQLRGVIAHEFAHIIQRDTLISAITATIAGAPPSPTLLGQLRDYNFHPIHLYGLTETYGPIAISPWQSEWLQKPLAEQAALLARQGQSYRTADLMRVVDEKTQDVPQDGETMGEVVMHGNNVMHSYFEQADTTAEAFRDGWFHSGDLAVWHPDGTVELRDRQKDVIISGGENVYPREVEDALYSHAAVAEAAVIGVPDEKFGEAVKAIVVLKDGAAASAEELVAFCRERLAGFKQPRSVDFIDELPRNPSGKVLKRELREPYWEGQSSQVS